MNRPLEFNKLPFYTQIYIQELEQEVRELNRKAAMLNAPNLDDTMKGKEPIFEDSTLGIVPFNPSKEDLEEMKQDMLKWKGGAIDKDGNAHGLEDLQERKGIDEALVTLNEELAVRYAKGGDLYEEKECVKCKLRELTKGQQSSFAKDTLLLEARRFMIDDGYNLDAVQSFDSSKINGGFSVTELMVEFYQYLTKKQK